MSKEWYQIAVNVVSTTVLAFVTVLGFMALGFIGRLIGEMLLIGWNIPNIWGA